MYMSTWHRCGEPSPPLPSRGLYQNYISILLAVPHETARKDVPVVSGITREPKHKEDCGKISPPCTASWFFIVIYVILTDSYACPLSLSKAELVCVCV